MAGAYDTFEYYAAESENGWCKIPRQVVDDMLGVSRRDIERLAAANAEIDRLREELHTELTKTVPQRQTEIREFVRPYISRAETAEATVATLTARVAELKAGLTKYADDFCEMGTSYEGCGKLDEDSCGGCRARALLQKDKNHG